MFCHTTVTKTKKSKSEKRKLCDLVKQFAELPQRMLLTFGCKRLCHLTMKKVSHRGINGGLVNSPKYDNYKLNAYRTTITTIFFLLLFLPS